jgi:hypothetical protein
MAFQLSESEFQALLLRIAETYSTKGGKTIVEWIDSIDPDPKVREKLQAVLTISIRCEKENRDPMNIRKLICWRDPDGKSSKLEAEWKGHIGANLR